MASCPDKAYSSFFRDLRNAKQGKGKDTGDWQKLVSAYMHSRPAQEKNLRVYHQDSKKTSRNKRAKLQERQWSF